MDISDFELSKTLSNSLEKVSVSYNVPKSLEDYPDTLSHLCNEQLKFFSELISVICKEDQKVTMELKIIKDNNY